MATTSEFSRFAEGVQEKLIQLLGPFGFTVGLSIRPSGGYSPVVGTARPMFEARYFIGLTIKPDGHPLSGQKIGVQYTIDEHEYRLKSRDQKWVDRLPMYWARAVLDRAVRILDDIPLPPAPAVDWRPAGAIPEDYHAG